jgi:hypothetical protein
VAGQVISPEQSGLGREFSLEGMLDGFTQRKSVTVTDTPPRGANRVS